MELKDALITAINTVKEVAKETGVSLSTDNITSAALSIFIQASKETKQYPVRQYPSKFPSKYPSKFPTKSGKLATEKQIGFLQKLDKANHGAIMKDLLAKGIKTTAGLTMDIASELITKFSKSPGQKAEAPVIETKKQEVILPKETALEKVPVVLTPTGEKASEKQIKYLYVLASKLGHGNGKSNDYLKEYFKVAELGALTKAQAGKGITALLTKQMN